MYKNIIDFDCNSNQQLENITHQSSNNSISYGLAVYPIFHYDEGHFTMSEHNLPPPELYYI